MSEFEARIVATLDAKEAEKKLNDLTKEHEVKLKTDFDEKSTQKGFDETVKKTQKKTEKNPIQVPVDYKESKSSSLSQLADRANHLFSLFSNANAIDWGADQIRGAVNELKEMDSIITEISKTSDSTASELKKLANESFDVASEYGRKASDYLTGIQEMNRSGLYGKQGEEMAQLSLLGQAAGDMSADVSNSYLLATNAAYDYAGSVEKLNTVLDGQNMITNRNSVSMLDMAQATSKAASMASQTGVEVDELSAIIGTATSRTKQNGNIIGTSLKSLFVNLQDTSNEKIVNTFEELGISQTKFIDGSEQLKTPIELLKELAVAYNKLPEGSTLKADVLRNIGQKRQANVLSAILGGISSGDYDKMISDYSQGKGSAMVEAEKSAENLEGRLNSLSNSWTEFISKFAQTDTLKGTVSFLDGIVSSLTTLQDSQLFIPSMLSAIMGLQNVFSGKGITDIGLSKDGTGSFLGGKLNVKGSLFGIDFTQMGNWKKHFAEAETELENWNNQCLKGETSVDDFTSSFKDNNAGFKAYISTVKDGTANIKDYRQSLEDSGKYQRTFSTSAKSVLANAASGLLVGAGIELSLAALTKVADELIFKQDQLQEKADVSASAYSSTVSEIESINSELATTQARIDELKSQDKLLPGDEAELIQLEKQNSLLQTQLEMKERLAASQAKETAKATKESIDYSSEKSLDTRMDRNGIDVVQNVDRKEYVRQRIAEMEKAQKQIDEAQKELENKNISDDKRDMYEKQFEQATANLEKYKKEAAEILSELNSESENFYDKQTGQILEGYEDDVRAIIELNNAFNNIDLSPIEQQMQSINSYFDGSTTSNIIKEQLLEAVQSGESATDALHRMGVTLNDLGITGEGKKAVFDDYFRGLVDSAEEAKEAVKSIDGSVDGVKAAFESENQDTNWKSMSDLLKQAGDLYKAGKIGTDDFQSAVQFIAPKEINPDSTKFDAQAYVKAYEKYKDKIKRYFDSENEKKSAANLQNDLIDKGLAKQTDNGIDWVLSKFKSSADAAKAWGISIEAAEVAMHNLESYGAEFDNVMFSGEGLQSYQKALEQIKGIYDSMDDNSEGKERLKNIIDQSELDDFENNLDSLTEDKIINIQFEYDLATVQQQIDEIKNGMVGSGGTTEQYMSLIASQTKKRDMLAEQKGMSKATSDDGYESSLTAFDNLAQKLISEYDTLGESGRRSIQQQQSALLDLQSSYLDLFQRGEVTDWDSFFGTKEADGIISKLAKDTGKSVEEVQGELAKLTGVDADDIEINATVNDEATPLIESMISLSTGIPKEIVTELLAEDKASDETIKVLSEISGIPEEKITEINANDGASGVLATVLSQITGIPKSKITKFLASDDVSGLAKKVVKETKKIPPKTKTKMTATDGVTPKANSAKSALAGVKDKKVTISAVVSNSVSNAITKVKNALGSVGAGASFGKKGGKVKLNGTAHKSGTAKDAAITPKDDKDKRQKTNVPHNNPKPSGHALATGTIEDDSWIKDKWKTKKDEVALTGEVGQEIIVHGNTWQTVGDNGAEFAHIPAGSVVFNAKQTEELLKKGSINSRGKAYLSGTAYGDGMPNLTGSSSSTKKKNTKKKSTTKSKGKGKGKGKDTTKKDSKKFKETFDWIEVAIDRIERAIDRLNTAATSIYRSWSVRNKNLKSEISSVNKEIKIQQQGFKRYNKEADKVSKTALKKAKDEGFTKTQWDSLTKKVRDGKIDISTIKNEKLATRIKEYKEWHEKALDCKDAIVELEEKVSELYETAFNDVVTKYEGGLSVIEHKKNMLDEAVSQSEEKGYITSVKYYDALIKNENANIDKLKKERTELIKTLNEGVKKGNIKKESEAWYEMVGQINDVTLSIEEANTAIIGFGNSIRDIQWEVFDLLQKKITHITDESKFLTDLLSNDKLYTDKGQLTDEGLATMGLHGVNYNVDMAQADKYAKEIANLDKQIAKNPYDQNLLERRQELLELQQDMILAAEDEKQAIRDMVEEGINKELDSLKDLIDTYTEAMDAQKDLYDYQKRVKDQTKEIANLQKMLDAYKGDTSEEAKSKVQEYKVSLEEAKDDLEETEYDRYVSDQKKMLDTLYDEYEEILNKRLDNIEALVSDMIVKINENAGNINSTLSEKAESVGYDLSSSMESIWGGAKDVLTTYGEYIKTGIENAATTVNATLGIINVNIQNMISQLNALANTKVQSANTSSASDQKKSTTSNNPGSIVVKQPSQPIKQVTLDYNKSKGNGKAEVGDKVTFSSGKYYSSSAGTGVSGTKNRGKSVYITRIKKGAK
ncbi:phage tail tape measure protein, partial [Lachnospiraceae bacterium MD308]|nr:phage tail tape measure protein [Lachnospiraceae bacterium MD308]